MDEYAPLLELALELWRAEPDVSYGEARAHLERGETLRARDLAIESVERTRRAGVALRVLARGAWGFACTPEPTPAAVRRAAREALAVARATASLGAPPVRFAPLEKPSVGTWEGPCARDPFAVPLAERQELLLSATRAALARGAPVRQVNAHLVFREVRKHLRSTEGTDVRQRLVYGGTAVSVLAVGDDGRPVRRSWPCSFEGDVGAGGYERIDPTALRDAAERMAEEACALTRAPLTPQGPTTLLVGSAQMAMQVHESCGHPAELDRAFGTEISLAGGSFLQPGDLHKLRYGSELVNLVADATTPGGLGTFGWDDEGVPAQRVPLVREGLFVGYLSSRETAAELGVSPGGAMRADGYARPPLIRMVNVNLEAAPAGPTLEELIADTRDGILVDINRSWSIDDLRRDFHFGCELAWRIERGKRTQLLRDPVYSGVTPRFWGRCDAVGGPADWRLWGITTCGKGDPEQLMYVGHGAPPARFREVEVGHG